jgi:peptidoglycan/xylan/chitin deacetylase (PgdA/CDA1 family)
MRIVSPFLKRVVYPCLAAAGGFRNTARLGLTVVTYHGVLPAGYEPVDHGLDGNLVSAETLRRQLRQLKAHYHVISPEDALAWREGTHQLPLRAVLLTCDDGLLNNLTDMLPVLQQEGVHCLFFVTGASTSDVRTTLWYEDLLRLFLRAPAVPFEISCAGITVHDELGSREQRRTTWWKTVQLLSQFSAESRRSFLAEMGTRFGLDSWRLLDEGNRASIRRFGLLTLSDLRELATAGMTIGAHTMSHPLLSELPPELARAEISECRAELERAVQERVWAFAYPFGDAQSVTQQVLAMPEECGYKLAFLNFGGGLGADLPPYAVPRVHVYSTMGLAEFEAHVSGFHGQLQSMRAAVWRR